MAVATGGMAQPALPPPGFDQLSPDEKLNYIQALWDQFVEHPEDVPVPEWHHGILAERLAAYRRGELTSRPWSDVREELLARLRTVRQMRRLHVSSEAELEIFEAALRYERQREGLGFRFEAQVNAALARLVQNPLQFAVIEQVFAAL